LCAGCASSKQSTSSNIQPTNSADTAPTAKNAALNKWLRETDVNIPPAVYRVEPPDAIKLAAPGVKELDGYTTRIRSDGKITLALIGDLYVAGMSPAEISQEIGKQLKKYYNKDSLYVAVDVTDFQSKKYYVFGQVNSPGVKTFTGSDNVIKVLADAELNDDAWPQKVVLVRPSDDPNVRQRVTIDLKRMYESGHADQNYLLEEGDLVYVPPSPLAEFRITFEKLLAPIIPVADFAMLATTGF
jgi:polysaccharide export outer membrane protein